MIQLKYNENYLVIGSQDKFNESLFVCMNTEGTCWTQTVYEDIDIPVFQRNEIVYKKATSSSKVAEFIVKNSPKTFIKDDFITVFKEQRPNIKMYVPSQINPGEGKCLFGHFVHDIIDRNDSGITLMSKLKEANPTLYESVLGRGKADLSKHNDKPPIDHYAKFHDFIKRHW